MGGTTSILFQGDSITDAFRKPEEINPAFQLGNGYAFLAAARLARDYPGRFKFYNRGTSGDTLEKLAGRWQADVLDLQPDILSLLVGINDTGQAMRGKPSLSDTMFEQTCRRLLQQVSDANQPTRFVIIEPFALLVGDVTPEWKLHLAPRQALLKKIAGEFGAAFVPTQVLLDEACLSAPPEHWAYDGVHLTHAGFQILADAWLDAVAPFLESPKL